MSQKRSQQEKSYRGGKVLIPSSHGSVSLNVSKRSLTAEAKKGNVPQSVSISAWTSRYLSYIEKETVFIFSLLHVGQLKLLV